MYGHRVVVLDNGAGSIKLGFEGEQNPRLVFPNCTAKAKGERQLYVGDGLLEVRELGGLVVRRPHDRGFLVNADLERDIWVKGFASLAASLAGTTSSQAAAGGSSRSKAVLDYRSYSLLLTEPLFNFDSVRGVTEEIVFEEFGFNSLLAAPSSFFSLHYACSLPLLTAGIRRLNLGGKALTNLLKETVSYRSLNMGDEGLLMEQLKEQLCWVSKDVRVDLKLSNPATRSPHRRDVVLPDGVHNLRGYVRPPSAEMAAALQPGGKYGQVTTGPWPEQPKHLQEMEAAAAAKQKGDGDPGAAGPSSKGSKGSGSGGPAVVDQVLTLNNELFMVPEALFRPSDIGLDQAGLPEVVVQSVAACPAGLAPLLYGQVVLTGGCCDLPGFAARFEEDLRRLAPEELEVVVVAPPEPELTAWRGASAFAAGDNYWQCVRSRKQYQEAGPSGGSSRRERDYRER
eukprot:gene8319-8504_t